MAEHEHAGAESFLIFLHAYLAFRGNNHVVAGLAEAGRRAVEADNAAAALAGQHIGIQTRAAVLVPDVHVFQRQHARALQNIGVDGDGAVIIKPGLRYAHAVELGGHDPHQARLHQRFVGQTQGHVVYFPGRGLGHGTFLRMFSAIQPPCGLVSRPFSLVQSLSLRLA